LEVLGDWTVAPAADLLAHRDIQIDTSPGPGGEEEAYSDLCGAYSLLESVSFADAHVDRRDGWVLEVRLFVCLSVGILRVVCTR
jgi:hypothetical protein